MVGLNQAILISKELNTLFYGLIVISQSNSRSCAIFFITTPFLEHYTVKLIKLIYVVL